MAGIFISYRRDDSRHAAGRLADDLALAFGAANIFRDVESIAPGVDFEVALDQALSGCAVMLVVIGPRWTSIADKAGRRRLDQPGDWIRIEVTRALQRDVRLIPVMLEDTPLPEAAELPTEMRGLVRRQALPLSDGRWRGDMAKLVEALERIPGIQRVSPGPREPGVGAPAPKRRGLWTGVALGAGGLALLGYLFAEPTPAPAPAPHTQPPPPAPFEVAPSPSPAPAPTAAPVPAPAPVPATESAKTLMPPEQLKAISNQVLQGRWQAEHDPTVFIEMQQTGERVWLQFQANGVALGRGEGRFDGRQLILQAQVEILGQPLMQGRCALQWLPEQARLVGPCVWPTGTEASTWAKRGG